MKASEMLMEGLVVRDQKAMHILDSATQMTNVKAAVRMIAPLVGQTIDKISKVTEFSSRTGAPKTISYRPHERWDGKLWLENRDPLCKALKRLIQPGDALLVDDCLVRWVPEDVERDGTTPQYLEFTKPKKL